nr:hypothetical protein [Tanacetum cinerariifolium]
AAKLRLAQRCVDTFANNAKESKTLLLLIN